MAGEMMTAGRQPRKPGFFWQGVLIVLPVGVLAGAGLLSLRQDRVLARLEATERAQALAEESAQELWAELTAPPRGDEPVFLVDGAGELVFPPSCPAVPTPQPLDLAALTEAQARLWHRGASEPGHGRGASAGHRSSPPFPRARSARNRSPPLLASTWACGWPGKATPTPPRSSAWSRRDILMLLAKRVCPWLPWRC
jgi:hypothetical protein